MDSFNAFMEATGPAHYAARVGFERVPEVGVIRRDDPSVPITATRWACAYCSARVSDFRDKCNCCGAFRR